MGRQSEKVLIGRQAIMDFLKINRTKFYRLKEAGLPIDKKDGGCWTAHTEQLEEWFKVDGRSRG